MTDGTPTRDDGDRADETSESRERTPVLEVEGLGHSFGDVAVFSDLDFTLDAGTVTALVGPNGSGKTTLLRAVLGLLEPDEGRVSLAAEAASDRGTDTRDETGNAADESVRDAGRRVGYLPQSPAFRPAFTVEETLQFYADLLDVEVDVSAVLERVGLGAVPDRRVDALSGGMTRLLGVGQAILGDPALVVLDEPTGDLDPRMTEYIFDVASDLTDDGMTVLLATHNLTGAAQADSVLLLDHGDVVAEGSPADFVARTDAEDFLDAFLALTGGEIGRRRATDDGDVPAESATPSVGVRNRGDDR